MIRSRNGITVPELARSASGGRHTGLSTQAVFAGPERVIFFGHGRFRPW
jgi:hypothetical protein